MLQRSGNRLFECIRVNSLFKMSLALYFQAIASNIHENMIVEIEHDENLDYTRYHVEVNETYWEVCFEGTINVD
jgi:hypothetical protein